MGNYLWIWLLVIIIKTVTVEGTQAILYWTKNEVYTLQLKKERCLPTKKWKKVITICF